MRYTGICVIGGSGFIGASLVNKLIEQGYRVRVPTRRAEAAKALAMLPGVELIECNVNQPDGLARALRGCDAAVNLVGILHGNFGRPYGSDFARAHVLLPQRIAQACLRRGTQRLLHVSVAAPSSRPGPDAVAAADSPRDQGGALVKGTGVKGDDAPLPSTPTAAADTPTAAQAGRGKPKVTEIFGKSSLLAPTMAKLQQKPSRLSSQGLGGMPDWDAPAARATGKRPIDSADPRPAKRHAPAAAAQKSAPPAAAEPLKTEKAAQQWVPIDPRLRLNGRSEVAEAPPESNMPSAEGVQKRQEPSHPEPTPDGMDSAHFVHASHPRLLARQAHTEPLLHLLEQHLSSLCQQIFLHFKTM